MSKISNIAMAVLLASMVATPVSAQAADSPKDNIVLAANGPAVPAPGGPAASGNGPSTEQDSENMYIDRSYLKWAPIAALTATGLVLVNTHNQSSVVHH